MKINFPHELARILLDDQEFLIRHRKLISLPHRLTVEDILLNFKRTFSIENETIDGMISFFNTLVGCKLLYKFEVKVTLKYHQSTGDLRGLLLQIICRSFGPQAKTG